MTRKMVKTGVGKDPNFRTILKWVKQLRSDNFEYRGVYAGCPLGYINDPQMGAELVDFIDGPLINNQDLDKEKVDRDTRLKEILELVNEKGNYFYLEGLRNNTWISIFVLSMWWGCLASAKLVAYRTRSGVNTVTYRRQKIKDLDKKMNTLKRMSVGFELGFKAGPYLRRLRGQGIYFFGIPKSLMVKYDFDEVEKTL